jgi:hypothetical protein
MHRADGWLKWLGHLTESIRGAFQEKTSNETDRSSVGFQTKSKFVEAIVQSR